MTVHSALPESIANEAALAAHIAALIKLEPDFGRIAKAAGEVPLRWVDSGFAGLAFVILGQQISTAAGRAIYNRLEAALGEIEAPAVSTASEETLRAAGLSQQKIGTLRAVAARVDDGYDLHGLKHLSAEDAIASLSETKGIGRWTAEVYLLFALGHTDIFPAGDLALQESARFAFGMEARPKEKALNAMADAWRPHRSAAARLLWTYYRVAKGGRDATPVSGPPMFRAALIALFAMFALPAAAQDDPDLIFKESTVWRFLSPDAKLGVYAVDDPLIDGVSCHFTLPEIGGWKGWAGLAEETSDVSLACRQYGPVRIKGKFEQGAEAFRERRSFFFKKVQIVRGCDTKRNVLVYLAYTDKLIEGSPKNSTSSVPIMPWGPEPAPRCGDFLE